MNDIKEFLRKSDEYLMTYHCSNCHSSYTQVFKKGERASQGECTNCGCRPLGRFEKDREGWM